MEVTRDPHTEHHRLEDEFSESTELPLSRSGKGPFGDGPEDSEEYLETTPRSLLNRENAIGLGNTE